MCSAKLTEEERNARIEALCKKWGTVKGFTAVCGVPPQHREDVVQEAMVAAYIGLDQLRDFDNFDGWLFRITKRKAARFFAESKKLIEHEIVREAWEERPEEEADAYAAWTAAERLSNEELAAMVERLPEPAPRIIWMRFAVGFSLKEIAELLEMNYNTVKTVERRAFKKLQAMIATDGAAVKGRQADADENPGFF